MVELNVTVLGCGSAKPSLRHHTSSQVVSRAGSLYMIDCGEGTQTQLQRYGLHPGKLEHIFISHGHGDHCLGLPGLLSTLSLLSRSKGVHLHVPADFAPLLQAQIDFFVPNAEYEILLHPIECAEPAVIFSDRNFEVTAFPLEHRVPCYGFLFREQPGDRHIKAESIQRHGIPYSEIPSIKQGKDFTADDGRRIPNRELTTPPDPSRSFAYLSDTRPVPQYAALLKNVDLLYHDTTYLEGFEELARNYFHSTTREAAEFATKCQAKALLLGHFSTRHEKQEHLLLENARQYFPNPILADEGLSVKI